MNDYLKGRFSPRGRLAVAAAALILLPVFFLPVLPIWHIRLVAPQYREGLMLHIFTTTVRGNLQTVNELNHYVGMKAIHPDEFSEFRFIPVALTFFGVLALLSALVNRRWFGLLGWAFFTLFGMVMVADFGRWLWAYGHELNALAPIKMKGFMPPVLGSMRIANFYVFSFPGSGTYLLLVAWLLGPLTVRWEGRHAGGSPAGVTPLKETPPGAGPGAGERAS